MSKSSSILLGIFALAVLALGGCTKPYIITEELAGPLTPDASCSIGAITDELPSDFDLEDKPTIETIETFKSHLYNELEDQKIFSVMREGLANAKYEVTGNILDYKKGSGFIRFLVGFGAGSAQVVVSLKLVDLDTQETVFGGNFTGAVSSWAEGGEVMFKRVAKDFAKQLKKQLEQLEKKKAKDNVHQAPGA
ncbi:MAG: DUF4410 domain-containing protein [Candidatus Zixiibacteriota bacterium]